tara:strand:+ start:98 stop:775 length:678 start_codon:yes stop_codon:yes gene_type:complete
LKKSKLIILYISLLFGLQFPDFDLHIFAFLGHRSIITHGIIVPFFLYRYLNKRKIINDTLDFAYIGFLLGIALHLCADLFPKAWIGFALIMFPPWIPMGAPFSIIWLLSNLIIALWLAFKKLKIIEQNKKTRNLVFYSIIIIGVIYMIIDSNFVSKIILLLVTFPLIWIYGNKGYKFIKKEQKPFKIKKSKKKFFGGFWSYLIGTLIVLPTILIVTLYLISLLLQ